MTIRLEGLSGMAAGNMASGTARLNREVPERASLYHKMVMGVIMGKKVGSE